MEVFSEAQTDFAADQPSPRKTWFDRAVGSILSGSDQQTAQGPQMDVPTPAH